MTSLIATSSLQPVEIVSQSKSRVEWDPEVVCLYTPFMYIVS